MPVFSKFLREFLVFQNINKLVKELGRVDLCYIDPPYNQHPLRLKLLHANESQTTKTAKFSKLAYSKELNRSAYNKKAQIKRAFFELISNLLKVSFVLIYNFVLSKR